MYFLFIHRLPKADCCIIVSHFIKKIQMTASIKLSPLSPSSSPKSRVRLSSLQWQRTQKDKKMQIWKVSWGRELQSDHMFEYCGCVVHISAYIRLSEYVRCAACVNMWEYLCLCVRVYESFHTSQCVFVSYMCFSICLYMFVCVCVGYCVSAYLYVCQYVRVFVCVSVYERVGVLSVYSFSDYSSRQ